MGGVCSGGTSTIRDAREGSESEFSGIPGTRSSTNSFMKHKNVSLSCSRGDKGRKALRNYDAGEPKLSSAAKKGPGKIAKKSASFERARISGLKKAARVLDTVMKSFPGLSKESVYGSGSRGNRISILAFEVANTIVKGENLLHSLSENSILSVEETLRSEGVQLLVSTDMEELLRIAASDKREEFDVFLREVIRFGDRCKDSQWHNLGRYFSRLHSDSLSLESSIEGAETAMGDLSLLARYTSELYHELNTLDRLEQDYRQRLEEAECLDLPRHGEEIATLRDQLRHQRKLVKGLKRKSLWSRNMEEVMVKFVDVAAHIHRRFMEAFGSKVPGIASPGSGDDPENRNRLGPTGLALHYANIIVQIDTIASRPGCLPRNVRDSLYRALPGSVKTAICSRVQAIGFSEKFSVSRVKAEMEKTSRWLVPFAANTIRDHQNFGWVGDWANAIKESSKNTSLRNEPIRLQTLYHAEKEKVDLYILELVVWLHHLISLVKQRVHSIMPLTLGSPSHRKGPKFHPKEQQFPPPNSSIPRSDLPKNAEAKLSSEDKNLLEEVCQRRSLPGISRSQELMVFRKSSGKVCPLSRSMESSPNWEMGKKPAIGHPSIDVLDLVMD